MPAREPPELPEGLSLLDRYTILDRIGGGGMADIYRAHDSRLDRIVVVKLLRNIFQGEGSTSGGVLYQATYTHFLQEARALSKLSHPNTLRIYDFGYLQIEHDEHGQATPRPFHVCEFLDGGTLHSYVHHHGALEPAAMLAIVDRVAGAVEEAHSAGILHRDIKPSNILFARVGELLMPKLADFGIARGVKRRVERGGEDSSGAARVPAEVPLFSPRWAAPEQLTGGDEGPVTDVYALGLVVAYMLSGQGLFEVPDIDATYPARVESDAFVLSRLAALQLSPGVQRVLMGALRAEPGLRFATPLAFHQALSDVFGGSRSSLPPPLSAATSARAASPPHGQDTRSVQIALTRPADARSVVPPEEWATVAGRRVRLVGTHEKLDLAVATGEGPDVRLRVTLLPGRGPSFRVNLKGLSCFVARPGGTPNPALVVDADGAATLLSARRVPLGGLTWSFGQIREGARVFAVAGGELVVPFPDGEQAVAIDLSPDRELIVVCRRN